MSHSIRRRPQSKVPSRGKLGSKLIKHRLESLFSGPSNVHFVFVHFVIVLGGGGGLRFTIQCELPTSNSNHINTSDVLVDGYRDRPQQLLFYSPSLIQLGFCVHPH